MYPATQGRWLSIMSIACILLCSMNGAQAAKNRAAKRNPAQRSAAVLAMQRARKNAENGKESAQSNSSPKRCAEVPATIVISIPKSGTTLMRKLLTDLTDKQCLSRSECPELYLVTPRDFERVIKLPAEKFWSVHLFYNANYAKRLKEDKCACLFIYRDPRDQLVSFMYYMLKHNKSWPGVNGHSHAEIINDLIDTCAFQRNSPPVKSILQLYESYLPWLNEEHVLAIRFEDIVGEKGGGSDETQLATIRAIAHHMQLALSDEEIEEIARNLFGGTETFRKGQIGSWKDHFTPQQKERFKQVAGQLLIDLGYESDFNW